MFFFFVFLLFILFFSVVVFDERKKRNLWWWLQPNALFSSCFGSHFLWSAQSVFVFEYKLEWSVIWQKFSWDCSCRSFLSFFSLKHCHRCKSNHKKKQSWNRSDNKQKNGKMKPLQIRNRKAKKSKIEIIFDGQMSSKNSVVSWKNGCSQNEREREKMMGKRQEKGRNNQNESCYVSYEV